MRILFVFLLLCPLLAQAKLSPQETERRCRNLTFEKQQKHKACAPYIKRFFSSIDPLHGKTKPQNNFKIKIQGLLGTVSGSELLLGYDYNQMEFGLFGGVNKSDSQEVGLFDGKFYGAYFQYNLVPYSSKARSLRPFMGAKIGQASLLVDSTGIETAYPYVGLNAGVNFFIFDSMGVSTGLDLHQIIHPQKNLFHLGSSLNLGIFFNF